MNYVLAAYGITGIVLAAYAVQLLRERLRVRKSLPRSRETNNG
jgi:heme exporter protein CcmD